MLMNRRIYKMLLFCMVSMLSVFVHAAELQVTYQIGRTEKTGSEVTGSLKSLNLSEATFFFAMAAGKMVPSNKISENSDMAKSWATFCC